MPPAGGPSGSRARAGAICVQIDMSYPYRCGGPGGGCPGRGAGAGAGRVSAAAASCRAGRRCPCSPVGSGPQAPSGPRRRRHCPAQCRQRLVLKRALRSMKFLPTAGLPSGDVMVGGDEVPGTCSSCSTNIQSFGDNHFRPHHGSALRTQPCDGPPLNGLAKTPRVIEFHSGYRCSNNAPLADTDIDSAGDPQHRVRGLK